MTQEEKIRLGKLYKRYNQCRDAELDRFWKNSVFVWVFLALCFAAFGTLVKDYNMHNVNLEKPSPEVYYLFLSIISAVGLILSWIWVWMARGLKAWYEVYETAIWDIESFKNEFNYPHQFTIDNYWGLKRSDCFIQRWFFDSKPFSPSKIVILIGWLLIFIWALAFIFSVYQFLVIKRDLCSCGCIHIPYWLPVVGIILFIIVVLWVFNRLLQSSSLRNKKHNDVYRMIRNDIERKAFSDSIPNANSADYYNMYFEIKKDEVSFSYRSTNGFEKGHKMLIHYFKCSPKKINLANNKITFDFNAIQDFYDKGNTHTIVNTDEIKSFFDNANISYHKIDNNDTDLEIYFHKDYYKLHTYMIASSVECLVHNFGSQFRNIKVVIN